MQKHSVLFFHDAGLFYGSTEKLLQLLAKYLTKDFNVYFAYCPRLGEQQKAYVEHTNIHLVPFDFTFKQSREPHALTEMRPALMDIINTYHIEAVFAVVYAHYQFPMNVIPASVPMVLVSPFGHYCTNGGVVKTYVSGIENLQHLRRRGVKNAEMLFNPLEDFPPDILHKDSIGETVTFGRIGRDDDSIFDPIAVRAFKKLEDRYGNRVKYIVANPPPAWIKLAKDLRIKNMEFLPRLDESELQKFYHDIDVFAHARKDGETVGIAIAEAMMAGNPVLSHKSHFHNEHLNLLDTSYARWSEADDVDGYFANLAYMVEHKDQIRTMGQLARRKALSIFGMDVQLPEVIKTMRQACNRCYYYSFFGRMQGYCVLYWENLKAMPFYLGKRFTYVFPFFENMARNIYRHGH